MKVLVACEYSGRVREAFRKRGHDAWSCDLLDTDIPGQHIMGDVLSVLVEPWDLIIAHPPCTYLATSGARWWSRPGVRELQEQALQFVAAIRAAPAPKIAIENPIGHLSTAWRKPDQIIQPWQFGHPDKKATCLWLKGLPKLTATEIVPAHLRVASIHLMPPSADRWKKRSLTFQGIADAMANQWG